MRGFWVIW